MNRFLLTALLVIGVAFLAGCASRIEGETSTPPTAGGTPGASAAAPPGETPGIDGGAR